MAGIDNGVLECMICFENFNQSSRLPKMLPCQHSLCLACVDRLRDLNISNNTPHNSVTHSSLPSTRRQRVTCPECREDYELPKQGFPNNITILRLMTSENTSIEDKRRLPIGSSFQATVTAVIKEKTLGTINKIEELLKVAQLNSNMDVTCEPTRSQINSAFHMALDIVKNRQQECLESLDKFVKEQSNRRHSIGRLEEFCIGTKRHLFHLDMDDARKVMEISKNCLDKLQSLTPNDLLMKPTFQLPNIEIILNNLGRLHSHPTRSVNTFQEIEQLLRIETNSLMLQSVNASILSSNESCNFNIQNMTPKTEFKVVRPSGVAITKDGTIVVISFDKHCAYLFSQLNESVRCFGGYGIEKGKLWNPQGVCVNQKDEIVIVDGSKYISIYNVDGQILDCFGLECRNAHRERYIGRMRVNRGITCDSTDRIFVCGLHDNVLIFQRNGQLLHNIGPRVVNNSDRLIRPFGIAVYGEILYVADRNESCILIFTTDGEFRGVLAGSASDQGRLTGARHVSVDQESGIIVAADAADNSVKAYLPSGSFFAKLDMENHGVPYGLATTKDHKLVVTTSSDKIVIWST
ncbi:uncharacterized protein LOC117122812 [Anneissia japonica]|uniref:uncharacterized protein LOC117122812 n=1 Tax=Anneissia japonica TaxID=1529436 RepID=UPI00142573C8|nr:uncharacterized protein LOC117122812 [Anneissia japonica]XP_033124461.1 uncharacterized protein LOC117122812 [Anneissia japonica]XP_033124462.1 uncharacterized protein LOC117122812 [Anneissia japonica]